MLNMTFPCVNPIQLGPSPFSLFLRLQKKISHCSQVSGAYFGKNVKPVGNCGTTYLGPRSKYNCSLFFSTFYVELPVSRYGRLKLKFLCERFSHCFYSFWSIELTRTRNTWSLTAVSYYTLQVHLMGLAFSNSGEGALFCLALVGCGAVVLIICLQCVVLWKVQVL